jgi:hypothetical protein
VVSEELPEPSSPKTPPGNLQKAEILPLNSPSGTEPRSSRKSVSASSVPQSLPKAEVTRSLSQSPKLIPTPDLDVLDDSLESSEKSPPIDNEDMEIVKDVTVDPMEGKGSLKLDSDSLLVGTVCTIHFLLGVPLLV